MRRIFALLAATWLLGGCTTNPIPEDYHGPIAHINDSVTPRSGTSADFFYVSRIDGRRIENSLDDTASVNQGRGFGMTPYVTGRDVAAVPSTFTIVGRTHYAAPILDLLNREYEVSGETKFTPLPGHFYVVKGVLKDKGSAVWIEDSDTHALAGRKIAVEGSAALGFFEK